VNASVLKSTDIFMCDRAFSFCSLIKQWQEKPSLAPRHPGDQGERWFCRMMLYVLPGNRR
jgi:hypothetical protein